MSLRKYAVGETATFPLFDASERPMFAEGEDKKPDPNRPMRVVLYSPGSRQFAEAQTARNNRILERMSVKGKAAQLTVEEAIKEKAQYLADCTHSWENVDLDGKQGRELSLAIYGDTTLGFIADQNAKRLGDWKDFSRDSQSA